MALVHPLERGQFAGFAAVVVVAGELAIIFTGAVLPTPLYALYQARLGFSNIVLTAIYAVYVLGNLIALLIFGGATLLCLPSASVLSAPLFFCSPAARPGCLQHG
jgi:hypothetical protein